MTICKSEHCTGESTEASGYCFMCAEELACLRADEGLDPSPAWNAPSDLAIRRQLADDTLAPLTRDRIDEMLEELGQYPAERELLLEILSAEPR